jgi:ABC-2 type transport system permease protein
MRRVALIAVRDFVATVGSRAFVVGLLLVPASVAVAILLAPRLFTSSFQLRGDVGVIDPTGLVAPELRAGLDARRIAARRAEQARQAMARAPGPVRQLAEQSGPISDAPAVAAALGAVPDLRLVEFSAPMDGDRQRSWLTAEPDGRRHLALIVVQTDAVVPRAGSKYGAYDLFVPSNLDFRAETLIYESVREAIVNARCTAQRLDRTAMAAVMRVPQAVSVTVTKENRRTTVRSFNVLLPAAFGAMMFIVVMTGGQALLTSTVEEKASRVIEVLLSAVSPVELMAGKLLGQMAVSLVALGWYIVIGVALLVSFAVFGLLNVWLIVYLVIFFAITYLVLGSLMMAIGSAVNDMREAQGLMMPIVFILVIPWMAWMPISRDPNSVFSVAMSFVPPVNSFAMLLRMTSNAPPPWWQVWLSIGIGVASVVAAIWFAAKVFRFGLLMYGKPPNFVTLVRWARMA